MVLGVQTALKGVHDHLHRDPGNTNVRRLYASLLLRSGDFVNAKKEYEKLVRAPSPDALSLNNLAWLMQQDDPHQALNLARRAVSLEPSSANFQDTLGWIELSQSDPKGAMGPLKRAHELSPDDAQISYHLARALDANGARAPAKALLQSAVAHGGFAEIDQAKTLLASWR